MLELLLEYGADPNITNKDGWASIHMAVKKGSLECLKFVIKLNN